MNGIGLDPLHRRNNTTGIEDGIVGPTRQRSTDAPYQNDTTPLVQNM